MKRKALGKGLSALLPDPDPSPGDASELAREMAVDALEPNPHQPRTILGEPGLQELERSIRESGIVQPIVVRRRGDRYQIVAGERRWRAAQRAGLETVPVTVREVPDERLLEMAIVENVQREDLSPLEEAAAYQRLQDELGLSQEDVARKVGKDRSTVANTIRLLRLPPEVRELLKAERLSAGHGRALLALERAEDQVQLAREAARKGLSVRDVESRVTALRTPSPAREKGRKDPNTKAAEERLKGILGTRVEISRRGAKGTLHIPFGSEAELNRIFELLLSLRARA
jgi:ParB family chromosome partitioning protein